MSMRGGKLVHSNVQAITLLTLVIQFLHCLLCLANYLDWVRHQRDNPDIGTRIVRLYLALTIIAIISYLMVSSVFYVWAWRYATNEDAAKRRRIWGIGINLLFADFPLFCVEVDIVWGVGFQTGLQALAFIFTVLSFAYNALRVWLWMMVRFIKRSKTGQPATLGGIPTNAAGIVGNPNFPTNHHAQYVADQQRGPEGAGHIVAMGDYMDETHGPQPIAAALEVTHTAPGPGSPHRAGGIIPPSALPPRAGPADPADGIIPPVVPQGGQYARQPYVPTSQFG